MKSTVSWQKKMRFAAKTESGHEIIMDAAPAVGGEDQGGRPKEMLLNALAGCTAMDVISILTKMRVEPDDFIVEVQAKQTEEHPKIFSHIHLQYIFTGDVSEAKVKKAVELSQDKYCGISEMLRKSSELSYEIIIK